MYNHPYFVSESERSGHKILCFGKRRKHKGLSGLAVISTKYAIVKGASSWYHGYRTASKGHNI